MFSFVFTSRELVESTIAMLVGVYENIIKSIDDLTTKQCKNALLFLFLRTLNIPVILTIGAGVIVGVLITGLYVSCFEIIAKARVQV